jgi:hypothetical protein
MKQFPIPSQPPRDDRDRPGSPKARDTDQGDDTAPPETYAKGGRVHGDEAEDKALFNRMMEKHMAGSKKYAKGGAVEETCYAKGGEVLGRRREFMKEPDPFSADAAGPDAADASYGKGYMAHPQPGSPQEYAKGSKKHPGKDKSLKTVTPRQ